MLCLVYLAFFLILLVKFTEALVRIFGRVGFDRSRRPVDSGLVGALAILGCCGTRKDERARRPYKISEVRESYTIRDSGSFVPPLASFTAPAKGSAASHHSGPPASVLRPEEALRPYREDTDEDDESAHIMGAWQPFPGPGNRVSYDRTESSPRTQTSNSGFSRVGGGRAHFDSPYAIAGGKEGSTLTFPSVERKGSGPGESPMTVRHEGEAPTPTTSVANVARMPVLTDAGLPAGRTVSQTAIIVGELAAIAAASGTAPESHLLVEAGEKGSRGDNAANVDAGQPRKKHWFNIRRNRRHSDGMVLDDVEEDENAVASSSKEPGRSFVVIRDRRPMTSRPESQPGQKPRQSLDESSRSSFAGRRGANS